MSPQIERAHRLKEMMHTPGWRDVVTMLNDEAKGAESELVEIMATRPDALTGKSALKYAIRARALRDFMEMITDEVRLLDGQK